MILYEEIVNYPYYDEEMDNYIDRMIYEMILYMLFD